jgi:hypothetical protein
MRIARPCDIAAVRHPRNVECGGVPCAVDPRRAVRTRKDRVGEQLCGSREPFSSDDLTPCSDAHMRHGRSIDRGSKRRLTEASDVLADPIT